MSDHFKSAHDVSLTQEPTKSSRKFTKPPCWGKQPTYFDSRVQRARCELSSKLGEGNGIEKSHLAKKLEIGCLCTRWYPDGNCCETCQKNMMKAYIDIHCIYHSRWICFGCFCSQVDFGGKRCLCHWSISAQSQAATTCRDRTCQERGTLLQGAVQSFAAVRKIGLSRGHASI